VYAIGNRSASFILEHNGQPTATVKADYDTPVYTGSCSFYDKGFGRRIAAASELEGWLLTHEQAHQKLSDKKFDEAYAQEREQRKLSEADVKALYGPWVMVNLKGECHRAELINFRSGGYINWRPGDIVDQRKKWWQRLF